ncbi:MAG TPA: hydrogenase maturation nickel metallochaperone HypA [Terracidiphilus sp.]|nr:hydrogenase maturation nickel metallochaperone HypA [Terracidiphilus sp.]
MHELSIVQSVVQSVTEWLQTQPPVRVKTVTLRVGALSAVVEDALQFGYGVATEGTPLDGTTLVVHSLPIVVYCPQCQELRELPGTQAFVCPACGAPAGDVRQGREIEIESLEIEDEE